jgi:YesN/AraC family two-component response regulator
MDASVEFSKFILKPIDHQGLLETIGHLLQLEWSWMEKIPTPAIQIDIPDSTLLQELQSMTEYGAITDIIEWATGLKVKQPQYTSFAEQVEIAARQVDFDTLNRLAQIEKEASVAD